MTTSPLPKPIRSYALLLVLAAGIAGGCLLAPVEPPCQSDTTCSDAQVCARDGTCADPAELFSVTITWRVSGQPATQAACEELEVAELAIAFRAAGVGEDLAYRPFRCSLGKAFFNRMPRRLVLIALTAFNGRGQVVASASHSLREGHATVELDLF